MKFDEGNGLTVLGTPEDAFWADKTTSHDLITDLLLEQADLTAVERFAQFHDHAHEAPLQGRYYSSLIPATPPGPGQQYGFEVDLDRCSGCKACVSACHSLNGLDEGESWRDVGLLIGGAFSLPVIQHVTSACHHCIEPACLTACPVDAYEKDPVTGIVRHLDDQCFGCQYCTLACPYDVPKFHEVKGIVRKCDMCSDRLSAGEAPACVQACPHEAIKIRIVDVADASARALAGEFLAGAPSPAITQPSTVYLSKRTIDADGLKAGNDEHLKPEHAHTPLVVMLVLTQMSVGGFGVELVSRIATGHGVPGLAPFSLLIAFAGLTASLLHLGRPLFAYRAVLGFRHSWLSREVVAFGMFANLAMASVIMPYVFSNDALSTWLLGFTVVAGCVGVMTSVMVYHFVKRPFWAASIAGKKFAGSSLILGFAAALACSGLTGSPGVRLFATGLISATLIKLLYEARLNRQALASLTSPLHKSARLLSTVLKHLSGTRVFYGIFGGIVLPVIAMAAASGADQGALIAASALALTMSLVAELTERWLFFSAVVKPKMPGVH